MNEATSTPNGKAPIVTLELSDKKILHIEGQYDNNMLANIMSFSPTCGFFKTESTDPLTDGCEDVKNGNLNNYTNIIEPIVELTTIDSRTSSLADDADSSSTGQLSVDLNALRCDESAKSHEETGVRILETLKLLLEAQQENNRLLRQLISNSKPL